MAIKTWFTQPEKKGNQKVTDCLSSCYYYDDVKRKLVRIRLELGRTGKNPDPAILVYSDRYVYFYSEKELRENRAGALKTCLTVEIAGTTPKYKINYLGQPLLNDENSDSCTVCDFSFIAPNTYLSDIHEGSKVTKSPTLPAGITKVKLLNIAAKFAADHILDGANLKASGEYGKEYTIGNITSNSPHSKLITALEDLYTSSLSRSV